MAPILRAIQAALLPVFCRGRFPKRVLCAPDGFAGRAALLARRHSERSDPTLFFRAELWRAGSRSRGIPLPL
jgi:hypothetical protein